MLCSLPFHVASADMQEWGAKYSDRTHDASSRTDSKHHATCTMATSFSRHPVNRTTTLNVEEPLSLAAR